MRGSVHGITASILHSVCRPKSVDSKVINPKVSTFTFSLSNHQASDDYGNSTNPYSK